MRLLCASLLALVISLSLCKVSSASGEPLAEGATPGPEYAAAADAVVKADQLGDPLSEKESTGTREEQIEGIASTAGLEHAGTALNMADQEAAGGSVPKQRRKLQQYSNAFILAEIARIYQENANYQALITANEAQLANLQSLTNAAFSNSLAFAPTGFFGRRLLGNSKLMGSNLREAKLAQSAAAAT